MAGAGRTRREIYKDILKLLLRSEGMCASLSEIVSYIKEKNINTDVKISTVVQSLSLLKKADLITSRWVKVDGKKFRIYCLKRS